MQVRGAGSAFAIAWSVTGDNLLDQPETLLPAEPEVIEALRRTGKSSGTPGLPVATPAAQVGAIVAEHLTSSLAWAALADVAYDEGRDLDSYAYARVGYHRGLDALRKAGWRGHGPVPWRHEPNRGVLRALFALRRAARLIGDTDEFVRLTTFLNDSDASAIEQIERIEQERAAANPPPATEAIFIRGED